MAPFEIRLRAQVKKALKEESLPAILNSVGYRNDARPRQAGPGVSAARRRTDRAQPFHERVLGSIVLKAEAERRLGSK